MEVTETGANSGPGYAKHPGYRIEFEAEPRRVRVIYNGVVVADSAHAMVMREADYPPVYYLPRDGVRLEHLRRTDHHSNCPFKGEASYWTIQVGEREAGNAVWSYEDPFDEMARIKDTMAFYGDRVDAIEVDDDAA